MFGPLPLLTLAGTSAPTQPPAQAGLRPLDDYFGINVNIGAIGGETAAVSTYMTIAKGAIPQQVLRYHRESAYSVSMGTGSYPSWGTSAGMAYWRDMYQLPTPADFMTSHLSEGESVVPPPPPPPDPGTAPTQAAAVGLVNKVFSDEFDGPISLYSPNTGSNGTMSWSPSGKWRFGPWYNDITKGGYVEFSATKSFNVNPLLPEAGFDSLQPLSKPSASVMRFTGRRVNMNASPAPPYKTVMNRELANSGQPANSIVWTGTFLSTTRFYDDRAQGFYRPMYVECMVRVTNMVQGVGAGFWMYTGGLAGNTHEDGYYRGQEVDILDVSGYAHTWTSHLHGEVVENDNKYESEFIAGPPDEPFNDWHIYGCLWETNTIKIYKDNVLKMTYNDASLIGSGGAINWFSDAMAVILSFAGNVNFPIDPPVNEIYMDFDWVRVWK